MGIVPDTPALAQSLRGGRRGPVRGEVARGRVHCRHGSHGVLSTRRTRRGQCADARKVTLGAVVITERVGIGHGEQAQQADLRARCRGAAHGRTPAAAIDSSAGSLPSRATMAWSLAASGPAGLLLVCRHVVVVRALRVWRQVRRRLGTPQQELHHAACRRFAATVSRRAEYPTGEWAGAHGGKQNSPTARARGPPASTPATRSARGREARRPRRGEGPVAR